MIHLKTFLVVNSWIQILKCFPCTAVVYHTFWISCLSQSFSHKYAFKTMQVIISICFCTWMSMTTTMWGLYLFLHWKKSLNQLPKPFETSWVCAKPRNSSVSSISDHDCYTFLLLTKSTSSCSAPFENYQVRFTWLWNYFLCPLVRVSLHMKTFSCALTVFALLFYDYSSSSNLRHFWERSKSLVFGRHFNVLCAYTSPKEIVIFYSL